MKLTDTEKTRLLAEGAMGWEVFPLDRDGYSEAPAPKLIQQITGASEATWAVFREDGTSENWQPLTNESHAAEVRERMRELGYRVLMMCGPGYDSVSMTGSDWSARTRRSEPNTMCRLTSDCALLALGLATEDQL